VRYACKQTSNFNMEISSGKQSSNEQSNSNNELLVNTENAFIAAVEALSCHRELAFDCEGVHLGRKGALTVISLLGLDDGNGDFCDGKLRIAYIFDVQTLTGERVFSREAPHNLRGLLEDLEVTKVTYDCRQDSDALFHQFGVTLRGVLELQVLDQAVRLQKREELPCPSSLYVKDPIPPLLQSMSAMVQRYCALSASGNKSSIESVTNAFAGLGGTTKHSGQRLAGPHKQNPSVWGERPLLPDAILYAAGDLLDIEFLLHEMRKNGADELPELLKDAVAKHSKRYEDVRDSVGMRTMDAVEVPIVDQAMLAKLDGANSGPRVAAPWRKKNRGQEKWESLMEKFRSYQAHKITSSQITNSIYSDAVFILQHDNWYTNAANAELRRLAEDYPFSSSQRRQIAHPKPLVQDDSDDYGCYSSDDYGYSSDE
jgi:hypothetical protein